MSLYNLLHGMNATAVMLLSPFAPTRIDNFPRFRNVFLEDEDAPNPADFYVYTRMGDGNRDCYTRDGDDCDDTDASVNPEASETWYDGVDADCAGDSDYDADQDGHDSDDHGGEDCDDADDSVYPGAPEEEADGVDQDCTGADAGADSDGDDCECGACYALELESSQYCVDRYDDGFDCTYCTFSFHVSNEDRADFEVVKSALMQGTCPAREQLSERYVAKLEEMYALELEKIRAPGHPMVKIADAPV